MAKKKVTGKTEENKRSSGSEEERKYEENK